MSNRRNSDFDAGNLAFGGEMKSLIPAIAILSIVEPSAATADDFYG